MNPVDRSLLAIYSDEQESHLSSIRGLLDNLANRDADARNAAFDELMRRLHTLKGAARAVGITTIEHLTHQAEEMISRWQSAAPENMEPVRRALERTADLIEDVLAAIVADRPLPDHSEAGQELVRLARLAKAASPEPSVEAPRPEPVPAQSSAPELLRIDARGLDDLLRDSSELLIGSVAATGMARLSAHAEHLEEAAREWQRLRRAAAISVQELEQYPQFRTVAACLSFIDNRLGSLGRQARTLDADLANEARALRQRADRVHEDAYRIRMTPASVVLGTFGPMVRDVAQQEGKLVSFHTEGLETTADLVVLQGLKDTVMHLLRNAVSHGVEKPDERERNGKNPEGSIVFRVGARGDRLALVIEDDGRGVNYEDIAREARSRGLLGPDDAPMPPEQIAHLVFQPGFSTSRKVTGVSGRGMGLSVAQRAVQRLHGEISVQPRPGGGTSVLLFAPISISTQHVLLVSAGSQTFGLSAAFVDQLIRIPPSEIRCINGREFIPVESHSIRLIRLANVLNLAASPTNGEERALPCAILNLNGSRIALVADSLVDEREAVIKDTGLPDSAASLTAGAIPMEDGTVAVMLNVNSLFHAIDRNLVAKQTPTQAPKTRSRKPRILVVDDSLTTRSLEKSILEAHGYQVRLAVDGLEALDNLRIETPDLVISDVMMPRLTGFQLLERMKGDIALKKIPVILVTSLESREEQQKGLSLGADAYIVKRKFDQRELLDTIRQII